MFAADDDGDDLVFSITGGSGQPYFEIEKITNEWGTYGRVKTSVRDELDFDTFKDTYEIKTNIPNNPGEHVILDLEISVSDGYSEVSRTVYAAMFNNPSDDPVPNQAPTSISLDNLSVDENSSGAHIATISGVDPDGDELTYNIEGIGDYHMVHITDNVLHLNNNISANYENKSQLEVTLRAEDPGGLYTEQFFTIDVVNDPSDDPPSNQAPTSLNIEIMSVYENLVGEELGLISAYDPDGDDLIFELSGSTAHHFELIPYEGPAITLEGWQGVTLKLNDNWYYDYETLANYGDRSLTIKVSDPEGLSIVEDFQYEIIDDISDNNIDNESPISISLDNLNVNENIAGAHIANISGIDPEDDALTYSVLADYDGEMLEVNGSTLKFKDGVAADYEQSEVLHFMLRAKDPEGLSYDKEFHVNITNDPYDDNVLTSFEINNFELVTFKTQPQGNVVDGWPISFSNIIEEHPSSEFLFIKISGVADKNVDFLSLNIVAHPFNNVVNKSIHFPSDYQGDWQGGNFEFFLPLPYEFSNSDYGINNLNGTIILNAVNIYHDGQFYDQLHEADDELNFSFQINEDPQFINLNHYHQVKADENYEFLVNYIDKEIMEWGSFAYPYQNGGMFIDTTGEVNIEVINVPEWISFSLNDNKVLMQPDNFQIGEHSFDIKITDNQGNSEIKSVKVEILASDDATFNSSHSILDSNLVWTNGSDITITVDTLDSPGGSVTYYTDGSKSGFNSNGLIQQPTQVSFTPLSDGNMVAVWAVDIWKDLGDGTWSSTSTVNSDNDIFYRVFNPVDGTFVTDEVRITDTVASEYIHSVIANDRDGFTINYSSNYSTPLLDNFADKAFLGVTGFTPSNEAAFIFGYDNGEVGFGLFTNGGYSVKHPNGGQSGAGGSTQPTVNDVIRVFFEENYNSLLENVVNYAVLDIETFKKITNTINPYDASHIENTHLNDLTWNKLIGSSDTETYEYGYLPTNENLFRKSFQDALSNLGFNDGYSMSGDFPKNENEYIQAITLGSLKAYNNGIIIETEFLPLYNDIITIYAEYDGHSFSSDKATFTASIDKWGGGGSDWMDGPSMKLYRKDIADEVINLVSKPDTPGHKHKEDMDKGSYELRVEHDKDTDGAINIDDVMGVLSLSRGITNTTSDEHKLAADWNGDGTINIDDVMGVLSRSRGIVRDDEWRFYDKVGDKSLWDNASKSNKMDIVLDEDNEIDLTAILRGDVNASYKADQHNRPDPSPAPTPNYAPLPLNNDDELLTINPDIV